MDTSGLLWLIALIFLLGIFPLYLIVKILGGRISLMKTLIIKVAAIIITLLLSIAFGWAGPLLVAIILILLYRLAFNMGIIRSFLAWLLEGVVLLAMIFLLGLLGLAVKWSGITAAFQHLTTFL